MLVKAHMAGPPLEEEAVLLPLYCLQARKHLFQLPPLLSVNFQFLLGHLPTALMQRTHRLWFTIGMAPPGKRRVEKNLVGDALGTRLPLMESQRIASAPNTSQLYIYLTFTQSMFSIPTHLQESSDRVHGQRALACQCSCLKRRVLFLGSLSTLITHLTLYKHDHGRGLLKKGSHVCSQLPILPK